MRSYTSGGIRPFPEAFTCSKKAVLHLAAFRNDPTEMRPAIRSAHISMSRGCVVVFHGTAGERGGVIRHLGSLDDGDHSPWSRNPTTPPFRGLLVITRTPKPVLEVVTRRLLGDLITSSYRLQAPSHNCIYIRRGRSSLDSSLISILILTIYTVFYQVPYPLHKPTTINQHVRKHDYFVD